MSGAAGVETDLFFACDADELSLAFEYLPARRWGRLHRAASTGPRLDGPGPIWIARPMPAKYDEGERFTCQVGQRCPDLHPKESEDN